VGPEEKKSWRIGVGVEFPLFNGFRARNQVREARARAEKLEHQQGLLRDGLALRVKYLFLNMTQAQEQEKAAGEALRAAQENRRLNVRAYQADLVEMQDVIAAQLMEAFAKARYLKLLHDHYGTRARLEFVIGEEVDNLLRSM
jgi:outer membrane protein TolC